MSNILDILASDWDNIGSGRAGIDERGMIFEWDTHCALKTLGVYDRLKKNSFLTNPDGAWGNIKPLWEQRYIPALESGDLRGLLDLMRNFFRNELSAGLISHVSERNPSGFDHEGVNGKIVCDLVACARRHPEVQLAQLEIPCIGNPYGLGIEHHLIVPDAPRHYSHAKKIIQLMSEVEYPRILEIGAGYGGVLYMLQSLMAGKRYQYVICDLECVLFIALYFLQTSKAILNYPERISFVCDPDDWNNEDITRADIILVPATLLSSLSEHRFDLVYNSNSFSEMDGHTLKRYFDFINVIAPQYIFLMANLWGGLAFDYPTIKLSDFPISEDYKVAEWCYAPWIAGAGKSKEVVYARMR